MAPLIPIRGRMSKEAPASSCGLRRALRQAVWRTKVDDGGTLLPRSAKSDSSPLVPTEGACLVSQQADLIRWCPPRAEELVWWLPARQAHPLAGRRHAGSNPVGLAGGR